jgi:hypothetical protein
MCAPIARRHCVNVGEGAELPEALSDEQQRPAGGVVRGQVWPGTAGQIQQEESRVGVRPPSRELGAQSLCPCGALSCRGEGALTEEPPPHCMASSAVLGEGQVAKPSQGALAHQQAGVHPGRPGPRVSGALVHQGFGDHLEAVSCILGDGEELCAVQEGADSIGGRGVRAPEDGEGDAAGEALEARLDA